MTEANRIRRSSTARHLQCPNPSFDTKEYIVSDCGITEQLLLTVELLCTRGFREVQMSSPTNHKQRHPKKSAFSCEPCRKRKVCASIAYECCVLMISFHSRSNAMLDIQFATDVKAEKIIASTSCTVFFIPCSSIPLRNIDPLLTSTNLQISNVVIHAAPRAKSRAT